MANLFFEITVKDEDFRKIGTWKFKKKDSGKFFKIMNENYGLGLRIQDAQKKDNRDLDWMR